LISQALVAFSKVYQIRKFPHFYKSLFSVDSNSGTLFMDATCTPADIAFPQDINLINKAREKTEEIIDELHEQVGGKKPRTDRRKARRNFLHISKAKKKPIKVLRKVIRNLLGYLQRNIRSIVQLIVQEHTLPQSNQTCSIPLPPYMNNKSLCSIQTHIL
jgi:hypothetical protein